MIRNARAIKVELAQEVTYPKYTSHVIGIVLAAFDAARAIQIRRFGDVVNERLQLIRFGSFISDVTIQQKLFSTCHIVNRVAAPLGFIINIPILIKLDTTIQKAAAFGSGL